MFVLLCLHLYCTVYLQQIRRYLHDERVTHATHFDLQALVTVVVSLSSSGVDFEGGLFVSTGSVGEDSDSDMYVPLQAGDAVHDCTRLFDMPYILVMIFYLRFNFYFPFYLSRACVHLCISYCCLCQVIHQSNLLHGVNVQKGTLSCVVQNLALRLILYGMYGRRSLELGNVV